MDTIAPAEKAPPLRMRFSGREGDFFRILLSGSLLQIPTFGFYRFWLTTNVRRHIWSHTQIGEDAVEYTGRATELLFGFLFALAILVPVYVLYFIVAIEAERMQAFASVPLVAVTYVLGYYASYRARRYRATRTVFRGVRFWMTGSGWAFLGRAVLWDIATLLTVGLLYPWRRAALERYKMGNTHFGTLQGAFVGNGATLFKRGGWIWGLYLVLAALFALPALREQWLIAVPLGILLAVTAPVLFPVFRAIELRWWLESARLGPVTAASDLRIGAVFWCYAKTVLIAIAYSLAAGAAIGVIAAIAGVIVFMAVGGEAENLRQLPVFLSIIAGVGGAILYLAFLLGFDIIRRLFLDRGIWAVSIDSVTLSNIEAMDAAIAAGGEVPGGLGEGLLEALDVGGGF
ncbi:MAG: DUF898 family protein [Propylenella sp.]